MTSYPAGMTMSNSTLIVLSDALRQRRTQRGTRRRRLHAGGQARLVLAPLRKGETYTDLALGFGTGTTTAYRYIRDGLDVLAAMTPSLAEPIDVARRKAFVSLDGTLLRIDRVAMASGRDRPCYSGKHKAHGGRAGHRRPGRPADLGLTRPGRRTARHGSRRRARHPRFSTLVGVGILVYRRRTTGPVSWPPPAMTS